MSCENCGMSKSVKAPGGRLAMLSIVCTLLVLAVLIIQKILISAEAPLPVIRLLRYLRIILSIAGIVMGGVALTKRNLLGAVGIILALLGWALLPRLVI